MYILQNSRNPKSVNKRTDIGNKCTLHKNKRALCFYNTWPPTDNRETPLSLCVEPQETRPSDLKTTHLTQTNKIPDTGTQWTFYFILSLTTVADTSAARKPGSLVSRKIPKCLGFPKKNFVGLFSMNIQLYIYIYPTLSSLSISLYLSVYVYMWVSGSQKVPKQQDFPDLIEDLKHCWG